MTRPHSMMPSHVSTSIFFSYSVSPQCGGLHSLKNNMLSDKVEKFILGTNEIPPCFISSFGSFILVIQRSLPMLFVRRNNEKQYYFKSACNPKRIYQSKVIVVPL